MDPQPLCEFLEMLHVRTRGEVTGSSRRRQKEVMRESGVRRLFLNRRRQTRTADEHLRLRRCKTGWGAALISPSAVRYNCSVAYAPFDADRYAAPDLAAANAWRFGFDPDRQGGNVARLAALDDLGVRQPTVAASDGRFDSASDGLPESGRNRVGRIPSDQRGFRRPNRIGSYR
jgi:hypothetical protein